MHCEGLDCSSIAPDFVQSSFAFLQHEPYLFASGVVVVEPFVVKFLQSHVHECHHGRQFNDFVFLRHFSNFSMMYIQKIKHAMQMTSTV